MVSTGILKLFDRNASKSERRSRIVLNNAGLVFYIQDLLLNGGLKQRR